MKCLVRIAVVCSMFLPVALYAQKRIAVEVTCACDDAGGKAYVEALHTKLATHETFRESKASNDSEALHLEIKSLGLAPDASGTPSRTSISVTAKRNGAVMEQSIETCNRTPLDQCVQMMIEALEIFKD